MASSILSDNTIADWLEKWASETPDRECIVYSDRDFRLTWKETDTRVNNMAKGMLAVGIKPGYHVGIWATNVPDWLIVLYACAKIGAIAVTVNTNYKQNELEYLCKNADLNALFIIDGTWESDFVDMTYTMLPELKTSQRGHLSSDKLPLLKTVVYIGSEKHRGMYNTHELLLLGEMTADDELKAARANVKCHDVVNMQYTSGTTGFPKGVMLTHHNITNNGYATGEQMEFTQND